MIKHLVPITPQVNVTINIMHLLQPIVTSSHSILFLLFNIMVFNEVRLNDITPYEEELFSKTEKVHYLIYNF